MAFPLKGFGKILKMLYSDTMTVYCRHEVTNEDDTTDIITDTTPSLTNIPCRLSFTRAYDRPDQINVDENPLIVKPTIHCSPSVVTHSGDYCIVHRNDDDGTTVKEFKGILGDSRWYANHQEILILIDEES